MNRSKLIKVVINDGCLHSYDFEMPLLTSAEDVAEAIANKFNVFCPEERQASDVDNSQLTFGFAN